MERAGNKRKYCNHCNEYLTIRVFKRHRQEFYDPVKKEWTMKQKFFSNVDEINDDNTITSAFIKHFVLCNSFNFSCYRV